MTVSGAPHRLPPPLPAHGVHGPDGPAPARRAGAAEPAGVTPGEPRLLRATVPAHPSRAAGVRRDVAACLDRLRMPPDRLDSAVLVTDELFANAVGHGSAGPDDTVTLTVECSGRVLRVTVADRSPVRPRSRTADPAEESGRGLAIVAALADDWGVGPPDTGVTGKRVWFTLTLRESP
ncbi:ATP-binding protein [Streptomyces sp. NPDC008313]|uniref:ATP-binding protein n=1 Tax=Streptomyces sp. NPDC008313 TaxID=3364826 RepID=UPI0036E906EA